MNRIIISADELSERDTLALAASTSKRVYAIKVHELYDRVGPSIVKAIKDAGAARVWMDAKLHDIPNTVKARARAYAEAGVDIITVHASGGVEMLKAAKEGAPNAEIYGITVLTSLGEEEAQAIFNRPIIETVRTLALIAKEAGLTGVVCSPQEVGALSQDPELKGLTFVIPGTRSPGVDTHDQKRVTTPKEAIDAGATHLVIGRQITEAADPLAALSLLEAELA